jgi:hypothetical protein
VFDLDDDAVTALAGRIAAARGKVLALDVPPERYQALVDELDLAADADVRLVLGAACTTAARTVEHLTAALQLRYEATRGWQDLLEVMGDRPVSLRRYVVIVDAAQLLRHEDRDRWHELVGELRSGPHCMGGGWSTLVLADHPWSWEASAFHSAGAAQTAAA